MSGTEDAAIMGSHALELTVGRHCSRVHAVSTPNEPLVDFQVRGLLPLPGNPLLEPLAPNPAHLRPPCRVSEQLLNQAGEAGDVSGPRVNGRLAGQRPGLFQVE